MYYDVNRLLNTFGTLYKHARVKEVPKWVKNAKGRYLIVKNAKLRYRRIRGKGEGLGRSGIATLMCEYSVYTVELSSRTRGRM